jgi:hypothetical protein
VIKILVKDMAIGIPIDKQSELFIEDLGAEIDASSTAEKGSCFPCLIPLKIPLEE